MPEIRKVTHVFHERFDEFCRMCSLHGLIYLRSDVQLPICDRVFWITIFIASFIVSCVVIHNVWNKWLNNRLEIVYDANVCPIWDVPFPSVTICSFVSVKRSVVDLASTENMKDLFFSSLVCPNHDFFLRRNLSASQNEMKTFYDFLDRASPRCEEMMRRCTWQNVEVPCCKVFYPIITNSGRCFITNSLPSEILFTNNTDKVFLVNNKYPESTQFWAPERGYPEGRGQEEDNMHPLWSSTTGYDGGLSVELDQDKTEWQPECTNSFTGFKVFLNSPEELPISSQAALRAPMRRDFNIKLKPRTIHTVSDLISTAASLRGCLFQGEKQLIYFTTYTQNNCILECLLETSFAECGCAPFYMPRNDSIPVCSKDTDQKCLSKVEDLMVNDSMEEEESGVPWCGCYPSCNDLTYSYSTNNGLFFRNATASDQNMASDNYAKVSIYYMERHFFGLHRQEESTFYDFLGTCGGLLGLFMGFSCISAIEVFYHLIIRSIGCLALKDRLRRLPKFKPALKNDKFII